MDEITKVGKVEKPLPPLVPQPYTLAEQLERVRLVLEARDRRDRKAA